MARGSVLVLQRPSPPYQLEHLRPPEVHESAVFLFTRRGIGWRVEVLPLVIDDVGEPALASAARAEAIIRRVVEHSAALGTALEVEGGRGLVETTGRDEAEMR